MKIARCSDGKRSFWALIVEADGTASELEGPFSRWALDAAVGTEPRSVRTHDLAPLRLLAPVEPGAKLLALGATYQRHVEGLGLTMAEQPAGFFKTPRSIVGPGDEIAYPRITEQLDYEVELVVVAAGPRDPRSGEVPVLGYTVGNDVSARDLQFRGVNTMDLFSSKVLDDTSPMGPWIVTADEVRDPMDLELRLEVNGEVRQADRTSSMAWTVTELLAFADSRTSLEAGDTLFTGTPAGVGYETGRYLQPGDLVEATVVSIGTLRNMVGPREGALSQ